VGIEVGFCILMEKMLLGSSMKGFMAFSPDVGSEPGAETWLELD
jgi:hypothetical protein